MERIFISIYKFFKKRPIVMWSTMIVSFLVFAIFATRLRYEEDITKLLPQTDKAQKSQVVFEQMSIKDKLFVQIVRRSDTVSTESLGLICDELVDSLLAPDSCGHLIKHVLYRIEDDWTINGLDYAMSHFPSLLDSTVYGAFDSLLAPEAIAQTMKANAEVLMEDPEGNLAMVIPYDPAGLRDAMKQQLSTDELGSFKIISGHLASRDSSVVIAFVTPAVGSFDSKDCAKIVRHLKRTARQIEQQHPEVEVVYHGASALSAGNSDRIKGDLGITLGISLLIILVVILLCYRNKSTIGMILIPVVYGTAFAMACMYWIKGQMSLMALGLAAPILGIAMSYILHVLTHYKYVSNPATVLREQATPVCLSCITTIGAFAGLLFTSSELLQDFGIFASIALVGTTLFALTYMPQFFNVEKNIFNKKAFDRLEKVNNIALDRNYWLVGLIAVISIACIVISVLPQTKVKFDSDLQNIGYKSKVVNRSREIYQERMNQGYVSSFFAASAPTLDSALTYNQAVLSTLDSLKAEGLVKSYSGVSSMILTLDQQEQNIERWKAYWTPERIAQTRKAVNAAAKENGLDGEVFDPFFAIVEADYEAESIYASGVIPDELACNFVEEIDGEYLVFTSVLCDSKQTSYQVGDSITAHEHTLMADPFYYTGDMVEIVHNDFNIVLLISSIFVILVLLISYRSVVMALLAFLPMFLSWYIVQGIMSVFGLEFNLINIVLSSFIFGVGVDYSIFISNGLLSAEKGHNMKLLTHHKTAITFSAFVLIVVLGSLLLALHPSLHSVGLCSLIGMGSTILISYCLQPFLFRQLMRVKLFRRTILHEKNQSEMK